MNALIIVLLVGRKSAQSWTTEAPFAFIQPTHRHHVSVRAAHNDADADDRPSPKWKGSTYWIPPTPSRGRKIFKDMNGTTTAVFKNISMQHCGWIEIEEHPAVEILDASTDRTGVILWSAAYSIAEYIDVQCHKRKFWTTKNQTRRRTCLELGAGLGLPSIVAAKYGWNCIATEQDCKTVLPLLEKNARRNNLFVASSSSSDQQQSLSFFQKEEEKGCIAIESLDWTASLDQVQALASRYPPADLIVASDLIYAQTRPVWKDLLVVMNQLRSSWKNETATGEASTTMQKHQPLERFDGTYSSCNVYDPLVLLGYTQRRRNLDLQGEREFFALLREMGMEAVMIPMDQVPNSDKRLLTILFELRWK